ncbi:MAG TPA: monovalent cation/H(+) antiporter subunit G [Woeseiaceae bacterium]|nr:monovalent cation/H(+) antiporter subunit G [Woeseiaceae bacterium]
MMELLLDIASWFLLIIGGAFVFIGGVGALRMPDFYTRMHAASLTDTLGTILVLTGIILQAGLTLATIKLVAIMVFLLLTSPTAAYALANAARLSGLAPERELSNEKRP